MSLTVNERFTVEETQQTLTIHGTIVEIWRDERLALTSHPECWKNNEVLASACNETEDFTIMKQRTSLTDKVQV